MVALYLGRLRDLSFTDGTKIVKAFKTLPDQVREVLKQNEKIEAIAKKYAHYEDCLFLGRQLMFPIALEGALKLKEISYIHAEGYPAAEMKHGPIALISEDCPSVFLTTSGEIFKKSLANIQEVKARKGKVICVASQDCELPEDLMDEIIRVPECHEIIQPILMSIPVQLLSYHIALQRGCDVDKPRNLAKSVTVE
jgi:glucosamine--fructose-6-phosphate aminotransferase (isomerizing)